jgi:hypothetical protein
MIFPKPFLQIGKKIIYFHQTQDERDELRQLAVERKYHHEILEQQRKEVKYLARAIPTWLAKMGHAYWYKKSEREPMKGFFNPVRINQVQIGDDAYFLRVDTKRLPRGVMVAHLKHPDVLETLSHACGSTVSVHETATGFWYRVDTAYGRGNIPSLVGYSEMIKEMPPDSPPLSFPLGKGENSRPVFGDMATMINLLIGGTKGGGKSNAANVMLCTLLSRNRSHQLRVFLTDLKGGIEFADYSGVPHLGGDVFWMYKGLNEDEEEQTAKPQRHAEIKTYAKDYRPHTEERLNPPMGQTICTEPHQVLPMLMYIEGELDRRTKILAGKAKKIDTFNKRYPDKTMSYWLVVIDELATLMEDSRYRKKAALSLSEIARKGRAVGIFLVLATQTPNSAIVPGQIANNMDSRLAFRCGNGVASGVLLGSGEYDAEKLPTIPGRLIWKWGGEKIVLQAPLIEDTTIHRVIRDAKAGHAADPREIELAQKAKFIFQFALDHLHGECQTKILYGMVKEHGIRKAEVESVLAHYEYKESDNGPEISLNEEVFYLAPAIIPKRIARWLVPAGDFTARKHPHPEYNYDMAFAPRASLPVKSKETVLAKNKISTSVGENGKIEILARLSDELLSQLPDEPITQVANGSNGHTAIELFDNEPVSHLPIAAAIEELTQSDYPGWLK